MHQASREELLRLLPSVELPECVKQPLYEAGVMRALEDYEEEGVLTRTPLPLCLTACLPYSTANSSDSAFGMRSASGI